MQLKFCEKGFSPDRVDLRLHRVPKMKVLPLDHAIGTLKFSLEAALSEDKVMHVVMFLMTSA